MYWNVTIIEKQNVVNEQAANRKLAPCRLFFKIVVGAFVFQCYKDILSLDIYDGMDFIDGSSLPLGDSNHWSKCDCPVSTPQLPHV